MQRHTKNNVHIGIDCVCLTINILHTNSKEREGNARTSEPTNKEQGDSSLHFTDEMMEMLRETVRWSWFAKCYQPALKLSAKNASKHTLYNLIRMNSTEYTITRCTFQINLQKQGGSSVDKRVTFGRWRSPV